MSQAVLSLLLILAAFFLSGFSALVYETLWVRILSLVFGNTTIAVSAVLSSFMAGLSLGSYFSGKLSDRIGPKRLLSIFILLEILTAVFAALTIPASKLMQLAALNSGILAVPYKLQSLIWFSLSFPLLLIPTVCMGATLPILIKWFSAHALSLKPDKYLGLLYGTNTFGAVTGTAVAGFMLIPAAGLVNSVLFAGFVNLCSAALVLLSYKTFADEPRAAELNVPEEPVGRTGPDTPAYFASIVLFATGAAAMICEVAWTRVFALVLGSSTYAFTSMLISVLAGLALGSIAFSALNAKFKSTFAGLSVIIALAAVTLLAYLPLINLLPYAYVKLFGFTTSSPVLLYALQVLICSSFIFIPSFLMGTIFPWAVSASNPSKKHISEITGLSYSANTIGNIAGSALTGIVLIAAVGAENSLIIAILLYSAAAAFCFIYAAGFKPLYRVSAAALFIALIILGVYYRPKWDPYIMNSGSFLYAPEYAGAKSFKDFITHLHGNRLLYHKDGVSSSVAVYQSPWGERFLRVNGKTDASTGSDVPAQLLTAYIPYLYHPGNPSSAAVIGLGSGMTTGVLSVLNGIDTLDCIEIEPEVLNTLKLFCMANHNIIYNPKPNYIFADARHYFAANEKKYDIIASEPSNPWIAGISSLFTKESFELMLSRLNPGGIYCQWFHIYSMGESDFKLVMNTFAEVFPHVMLLSVANTDVLLLGSADGWKIDYEKITALLKNDPVVKGDLGLISLNHPFTLVSNTFLLEDADFRKYCAGSGIHVDNKPVLEFSAPHFLMKSEAIEISGGLYGAQQTMYPSGLSGFKPSEKEWVSLYNISGEGYLRSKQLEQAEKAFDNAFNLDRNDARTFTNLSRVYSIKLNHLKAEEYLKKALKIEPDYALAWFHLGMLYTEQGMEDKGLECLEKGLEISPFDPMGCLQTAMIYHKHKRDAEAKALIQKALTAPIANQELKTRLVYMYNFLKYQ